MQAWIVDGTGSDRLDKAIVVGKINKARPGIDAPGPWAGRIEPERLGFGCAELFKEKQSLFFSCNLGMGNA